MIHCYKKTPLVLIFIVATCLLQAGFAIQDVKAQEQNQAYAEYIQARTAFIQEHSLLSKTIDVNIENKTRLQAIQLIAEKVGFNVSYDTELSQLHETIHLQLDQVSA